MEERHRSILRKNRTYIVNNLTDSDLQNIVDYLIEKELLTEHSREDILVAENTVIHRARALMDFVPKRGPTAFRIFCDALIASKLLYMAERLDPSLAGVTTASVPPNPTAAKMTTASVPPNPTAASNVTPNVPIPKQATCSSNFEKKSAQKPVPVSIPVNPGAAGSQTTPDPKPEKYVPSFFGQQKSHEKMYPPVDEQEEFFADDWPKSLNMTPFGSNPDFTVEPCTQSDLQEQLAMINTGQAYDMTSSSRGRALIINNKHYDDKTFAERFNSDNDSIRMQTALNLLKFRVLLKANVTFEVLRQELKKEVVSDQGDAFILIILSYGGDGTVMCTDGKEMPIQEIVNMFSSENCPSLARKPKMFFIQACGVRLKDKHEFPRSESARSLNSIIKGLESLNLNLPMDEDFPDTAPGIYPESDTRDMLVAVATSPDEESKAGAFHSIFMLGLAYVLCNYSRNRHLLQLMRTINKLKKDPETRQPMQLCAVRVSLMKKLYFLPSYVGETSTFDDKEFPKPIL